MKNARSTLSAFGVVSYRIAIITPFVWATTLPLIYWLLEVKHDQELGQLVNLISIACAPIAIGAFIINGVCCAMSAARMPWRTAAWIAAWCCGVRCPICKR